MTDPSSSALESNKVTTKDSTVLERDTMMPLLATWLKDAPSNNHNLRVPVAQLFAELQKTYATVGSTAAQATEYTHAERARDKGHPRPRQHDQGSGSPASGRVNHSPVLSPTSGEFRNWLTAAHRERASPPNIVGVTSEEPETPASDETYEPSDELPDYATPVGTIIPRIEVDSLDSSTTPSSLNSETPEGPVRGCQIDAPHWVRHASARSSSSL
ncbi:hypothetical protein AA0119_g12873 [Alternaria tenuissima]|uniref:Uncharacterized protein n=2 Tax=Alternaria alternata complex TaxID=187734 RepID=A0A4Q4N0W1_ALTAL|nr:hypothetical protein AA0117_g12699 [Alternaria alternata]RYN86451.1 hypothetical protein AA0119_g12873 [Alternaria tenuissima]RYO04021.1 hypothetical protein AA0121_g12880 [Alternaria tenuissima]RYO48040.1 hypothetical protein AA0116_g12843 [Alternaria tenuissima]